mmetsp:Transcript_46596/g.97511  ORF Transcript_46596/g.97511 Transcript_46596/m.97511 type:complete len:92 (-) Transcript_46596:70-345(-)
MQCVHFQDQSVSQESPFIFWSGADIGTQRRIYEAFVLQHCKSNNTTCLGHTKIRIILAYHQWNAFLTRKKAALPEDYEKELRSFKFLECNR